MRSLRNIIVILSHRTPQTYLATSDCVTNIYIPCDLPDNTVDNQNLVSMLAAVETNMSAI